jgi:RND family efflux transporter MFP subunit
MAHGAFLHFRPTPRISDHMTTPPSISDLRINRDAAPPSARRGLPLSLWITAGVIAVAIAIVVLRSPRGTEVQTATATASGGTVAGGGISANGYVVARTKASVSAKIAGRMESLSVHEGSKVKRGEVIARIESGIYQAQVQAAKAQITEVEAQLVQARRDYERAQALYAQNLISKADLENAQTRVEVQVASRASATAQRRLAEANLENTLVRAPFDGTVLRKDAEVGEIVAPASAGGGLTRTAIVTMADLQTLEVEVDVNEAYISQIRGGQSARITLDAYPDTSFSGQVRQVVPTADRQKATVLVKVSILDRDPRILPEMGAKVVFETGETAVAAPVRITMPAAAVVRDGGATRVWIVQNEKVSARPIELGRTTEQSVEVRSGLTGGETVVVQPPATLKDGMKVRIAK